MKILSAAWQVTMQAENVDALAEVLRFTEQHYADVEMTPMDPPDAKAIPLPLRLGVSYNHADETDDLDSSLGADV